MNGALPSAVRVQHILGDGPINVGDDDFVVPVPQIDGALAATGALVLRGDAEGHIVGAVLQPQGDLRAGARGSNR